MTYVPNPIDTRGVQLPQELVPLIELLARNTHENWSRERIDQGWSYGPVRDDEKHHHPCLVPYDELPEEEKVFDRITSCETLKCILSMGFRISK